ncbi:unnamed protein product [Mytilus edulis]|uniref:Apple domain-containing protein n=1 Tax=Mytilus edulis TaxID=6550 RepID=A0A8S3T5L6_MYTED|nr:unnamed protein product [Mytilus edulis]
MVSISIAECDMRCSLNPRCVSFFCNSLTRLCILHSNPFTYTVIPNSGTGWIFYVTRDRTGRCPDNYFLYRQLDFCYQFRPTIKAAYISCPLGILQRIDTKEKQTYTMKITDIVPISTTCKYNQIFWNGTTWKKSGKNVKTGRANFLKYKSECQRTEGSEYGLQKAELGIKDAKLKGRQLLERQSKSF